MHACLDKGSLTRGACKDAGSSITSLHHLQRQQACAAPAHVTAAAYLTGTQEARGDQDKRVVRGDGEQHFACLL